MAAKKKNTTKGNVNSSGHNQSRSSQGQGHGYETSLKVNAGGKLRNRQHFAEIIPGGGT